jgi:hypothetical protein
MAIDSVMRVCGRGLENAVPSQVDYFLQMYDPNVGPPLMEIIAKIGAQFIQNYQ